jgi:hypothetical protein
MGVRGTAERTSGSAQAETIPPRATDRRESNDPARRDFVTDRSARTCRGGVASRCHSSNPRPVLDARRGRFVSLFPRRRLLGAHTASGPVTCTTPGRGLGAHLRGGRTHASILPRRARQESTRPHRRRTVNGVFVARVSPGRVDVLRDGQTMVDSFSVAPGARLRDVMAQNGWRPTGRFVRGRAHDSIIVIPIKPSVG